MIFQRLLLAGRARYRVQKRGKDPNECFETNFLKPLNRNASEGVWSDYDGDAIHGDYRVTVTPTTQPGNCPSFVTGTNATASDTVAHAPGRAQTPWSTTQPGAISSQNTSYFHGNLVGSTGAATTAQGSLAGRRRYTAFGEPIEVAQPPSAVNTRFGYCGAYGYQGSPYPPQADPPVTGTSGDPLADLGWLHVGARYYDPASGRFMQRDPIGIRGGLNTYAYARNRPTSRIDPSGLAALSPEGKEAAGNLSELGITFVLESVLDVPVFMLDVAINLMIVWHDVQEYNEQVFVDHNDFGHCAACGLPFKFRGDAHLHGPKGCLDE